MTLQRRGVAVYSEDVLSGRVDFKSKAAEYQASLRSKRKRKKRQTVTPGEAVLPELRSKAGD